MEKYRLKTKCSKEEGENDKRQPDQRLGGRSLAAYGVHIDHVRRIAHLPKAQTSLVVQRSRRGRLEKEVLGMKDVIYYAVKPTDPA